MDSRTDRGNAIGRRLEEMGISVRSFASRMENVPDRGTIQRAIDGDPSVRGATYGRIEAALSRLWNEMNMDGPDAASSDDHSEQGLVEFEVSGDFGVRVVVKGPVSDRAALEESVLHLVRSMRNSTDGDTPAE